MSIFDKQPPADQEDNAQAAPQAGKQRYQAFSLSSQEQRYLEIRPKFPDSAECPANAQLINIRADWRMGIVLSLAYASPKMLVIIRGENLTELYRALKQWKVEWISEFSPSEHVEPDDSSAPFIRSITIHTTRPEEPPPEAKRH